MSELGCFMEWTHGKTWYRIIRKDGDGGSLRTSSLPPVIVLHGGPGTAHNYVLGIAKVVTASGDRDAVVYDQIGCGLSTHYPGDMKPKSFWTPELFMDELECLIQHLGISEQFVLVGHSWGGMLAMQFAATRKHTGLKAMIICNSPASMKVWISETSRLRNELPSKVQELLKKHEDDGTTDSAEYQNAVEVFNDKHFCRVPMPQEVLDSFAKMKEDMTVYHTMCGPSEMFITGSLREWDILDQLCNIEVATLIVSGQYDEATPEMVHEIHERIKGSRWELFKESSHMPHIEELARFKRIVEEFLAQ